jgi:hypothetical protein
MTNYSVINPPAMVNGQPEDISIVLANFQAIQQTVGNLTDENIAPGAGIQLSKLATTGTFGGVTFLSGSISAPGYVRSGADVWAWFNDTPVGIGHLGPASQPGLQIAGDTYLYRTAAGVLETDVLHTTNLQERSEKAQPNGYASLGSDGKVPLAQVPDVSSIYQQRSDKGVPNGYASLDGTGKVPTAQLPDLTVYQLRTEKGAASGYASLDSGGKVPVAQLPALPGNMATDALWDTKGDIAVATGPDAAVKLPVGANGFVLGADNTTATGLKWVPVAAPPGMIADTLWNAKGDLAVATADNTATVLAVGPNGYVLTADNTQTTGMKWAQVATGTGLPADTVITAPTRIISNKLLAGDAQPAWQVMGDGKFNWGPGGSTAPDTNLYRGAAGQVKTDSSLLVAGTIDGDMHQYTGDWAAGTYQDGDVVVYNNVAYLCVRPTSAAPTPWSTAYTDLTPYQQIAQKNQASGYVGLDASSNIAFASAQRITWNADTNLYRYGAGQLATDSILRGFSDVVARQGAATQVFAGAVGANAGLAFGSALDANLYRQAANNLRTDGQLDVGRPLWLFGADSTNARIWVGSQLDTGLYRAAAGVLKTDGQFNIGGATIIFGATYIDYAGAGNKLFFGSAADTNLYRVNTAQLKTDGSIIIGGNPGIANSTGLLLYFNGGLVKWVEVGPPDSAGAGYRHLQVSN